ncbi:MAG: beta-propeller domain-containing protein [Candidatus Aenigmarchaeota archaeon]|nr:beta-propeller domain-containing protein [Candidatus Aenigmarchaeota archaeon]
MDKKILIVLVLCLTLSILLFIALSPKTQYKELKKFQSYEELHNFIKSNSVPTRFPRMFDEGWVMIEREKEMQVDYSKTNIQVEGVDEADIVKTDGGYIYLVKGNEVFIVKAYPTEEMKIVSKIEMKDMPTQIFLKDNYLVVLGHKNYNYIAIPEFPVFYSSSFVNVYDITNRNAPHLVKSITITGDYLQSRMIDDYVYVIFAQNIYYAPPKPIPLPIITIDGKSKSVRAEEVYYFDYPDTSYSFTIVLSLDLKTMEHNTETFLIGNTQTIYMSKENLYLAYTKYFNIYDFYEEFLDKVIIASSPQELRDEIVRIKSSPLNKDEKMMEIQKIIYQYLNEHPEEVDSFYEKLNENYMSFQKEISKQKEKTIINKLHVDRLNIEFKGKTEVNGRILNQFSMDEYESKFRIATTIGFEEENNVYVFDENLNLLGKLEGIAPGERIYSSRFIGNKLYLVTFKQIDPFFVIDLSEEPKILGYLKIPGVSDYIHPYDDNHLIGFGRDADEEGRIKGLKISIFDVTDFSSPKELHSYKFGEAGSYSEATYEHKAFLFSKEKQLLVIPATISSGTRFYPWQGAIVFNVSLDNGISQIGKIDHGKDGSWMNQISRSLYIDDVLYTISDKMIKANSLKNLEEIGKIELNGIFIATQ